MLEDFRSRMGEVRHEMERLAGQAEELERVAQEQQVRLEEMDLLVRQRDEQLAEQQARVEELGKAVSQRDQELEDLRTLLAEREETLSQQEQELEDLRAQLAQREATEVTLREELSHTQEQLADRAEPPAEEAPPSTFLERLSALENLFDRQSEILSGVHSLIRDEMSQLHNRLDRLEAGILAAPPPPSVPAAAPPAEEAITPAVEVAAPPPPVEVVVAPPEVVVAVEDPLQVPLYEALEILPAATLIGLAGLDGLGIEVVSRGDVAPDLPLEVELADLTMDASRIASTLGTGPMLTLAFQAGKEHCLVSPVGEDYFAFLLVPVDSTAEFRRAQAVLLQVASRLSEFC